MKYKLIKTYPNSPKLGTIIESPLFCYGSVGMIGGLALEKGDYSEYWKEVKEGYHVLELTHNTLPMSLETENYEGESELLKSQENNKDWRITAVINSSTRDVLYEGDPVSVSDYPFPCEIVKFIQLAGGISAVVTSKEERLYSVNDLTFAE